MKEKIIKKLRELELKNNIKILLAVESGSRAWGFSSADSDYDVRCVHVSNIDAYLGVDKPRGQIDLIEGNIDIVSWDIKKFFTLFLKSNPTVSEWLSSDIIYIDRGFNGLKQTKLRKLFTNSFSQSKLKKHYLSLAHDNYDKYINKSQKVSLKKYVYILRAIGCIEFIKREKILPPLNWILSSKFLPNNIKQDFSKLVEMKKSSELNIGERLEELDKFIEEKLKQEFNDEPEKFDLKEIDKILIKTIKQNE